MELFSFVLLSITVSGFMAAGKIPLPKISRIRVSVKFLRVGRFMALQGRSD